MLLVRFRDGESSRLGAVAGDVIVDLLQAGDVFDPSADIELFTSMVEFFASGPQGLDFARRLVDAAVSEGPELHGRDGRPVLSAMNDAHLLTPVQRPRRMRDFLTHLAHYSGSFGAEPPAPLRQFPISYNCNHESVLGPGDIAPWPAYTDQLDFELELGFFVARGGRNISVTDAASHIAGVTIFNDLSARDVQAFEMSALVGPAKGKNFANIIGPAVLTYDEVDLDTLRMTASVNGEQWAEGSANEQSYSFEETLAWASYGEDVVPGEFIATGTAGGGCGLEQNRWIRPGDLIELTATGIGTLANRVDERESAPDTAGLPRFEHFPPRLVRG